MLTLDYERTNRVATSPPRRRGQSAKHPPRSTSAAEADVGGGRGLDITSYATIGEKGGFVMDEMMRPTTAESLSSRASKRLAEAIEFSATQSPASECEDEEDEADGAYEQDEQDDEVLYEYEANESEFVLRSSSGELVLQP